MHKISLETLGVKMGATTPLFGASRGYKVRDIFNTSRKTGYENFAQSAFSGGGSIRPENYIK